MYSDKHPQLLSQDQILGQKSSLSDPLSINSVQLQTIIEALKKFKKIQQKGLLNLLKEQNKAAKQIFKQMSSFFFKNRSKKKIQKKQLNKNRKISKLQRISNLRMKNEKELSKSKLKRIRLKQVQQQLKKLRQHVKDEVQQEESLNSQINPQNLNRTKCYVCKVDYVQIHHFYQKLCPRCAQINFTKRNQKADLSSLTALVTGGRIKIGYQIALRLLRDGAKVYVTSRFSNDTLMRYAKQQDFQLWKNNLFIIQSDFLSQKQVDQFIRYIKQNVSKLDILINNAAQTIVRPKQFYSIELENQKANLQYPNPLHYNQVDLKHYNQFNQFPSLYSNNIVVKSDQIDFTLLDEFSQPTDKRLCNSWVQPIQEVSLSDCYTTQVINSIVPFHLISQLRQKMKGNTPSWIINVSSMEGVFYRVGKQQLHPHTNMAKAALNMITRTCANQFLRDSIYMNSVDTGWVTNQNPLFLVQKMKDKYKFECPLDCIDGAMRVLDPIYLGVLNKQFPAGHFLKDYASSFW